jgi:hypothetical protein
VFGGRLLAGEGKEEISYRAEAARAGEHCIVCGTLLTEQDVALYVRGRRIPIEKGMVETFLNNKETYLRRFQARSALFQEEMNAPGGVAQGGINFGWFLFGAIVLAGVVFGGMSAYSAVSKDLPSTPYFLLGFFLNIFGYVYVLTMPSRARPGEIPSGLHKVPETHAPVGCPSCGYPNHPSARRCVGCKASLQPKFESEVPRA